MHIAGFSGSFPTPVVVGLLPAVLLPLSVSVEKALTLINKLPDSREMIDRGNFNPLRG